MAITDKCTEAANAAFSIFSNLPSGWTLNLMANGLWFITLTSSAKFFYLPMLSQVPSGSYANKAALAAALLAAAVDPEPATAPYREGVVGC